MRLKYLLAVLFLCSSCFSLEETTKQDFAVGITIAVACVTWYYTKGGFIAKEESCDDEWIKWDEPSFKSSIERYLHGQHLVEDNIINVLRSHFNNRKTRKALVLSFHGPTGTGKNFLSKLIANHVYVKGLKSKYVHLFISTQHFAHAHLIHEYQKQLKEQIGHSIELCQRSLFIFDEMDKMPPGLIDVLEPFINDENYQRNIFIFLSNAGGEEITKVGLKFWQESMDRSKITMDDIKPVKSSFHEIGGLKDSSLVEYNVIDSYIPFLPLEKSHVKLCIEDELIVKSRPVRQKIVETVADEMEYHPADIQLYSTSGCKKVSQKIDLYDESDEW